MAEAWTVDRTMVLTRREVAAVLADLNRRDKRRSVNTRQNLTVFRLAACCGLRASELCGIRLADVHAGNGERPYIQIRREVGKGGKKRRVPLWWDASTLRDIEAWKAERIAQGAAPSDPFVCTQSKGGPGRPLGRLNARARFLAACRVLGKDRCGHLTIHHGRHSFCSHALAAGRTLVEVRDAAGHANVSTTSLYLHLLDDDGTVGNAFEFTAK